MKDRSEKNGKVYKFKPKNKDFNYKNTVKKEFPKGNVGENESDIDLLMIFGMDSEAERKNPDRYNEVKKDFENKSKVKGRQEYISPKQRAEFLARCKSELRWARIRALPNILMLFVCVALEMFVFYDADLFAKIATLYHSAIMPLVALQIIVILCAVNYKKYLHGFALFLGEASPDSVFTICSTFLGAYYIFLSVAGATGVRGGEAIYNLYLTPIALLALYASVAGYIDARKNLNTFRIISGKKPSEKHVLTIKTKGEGAEGLYSPDGGKIISVEKTEFVNEFVKRTGTTYMDGKQCMVMVLLSMLVSFALFLFEFFTGSDLVAAFSVAVMSMMLTMPFSMFFSYSFIFGFASVLAKKKGTAIVGDLSFEEYPASSAVYFDDSSVFPPSGIKLKGFRAYGENRIDKVLYIIAGIYKKLRSPAASLFEKAVGGYDGELDIDILDTSRDGVRVAVNGSTVFVGGIGYMRDCGFEPEDSIEDEDISPEISVIYMAIGRSIVLKAYLEYRLSKNVPRTAEILKKHGMYLGICTCDPAINDDMMDVHISLEKYPIGIMKSPVKSGDKCLDSARAGIVSVTGADSLLGALLLTVRASNAFKTDMIIKAFTFSAGVILAVLFAVFGAEGGIGMWYTVFYQIFAALPTFFALSSIED